MARETPARFLDTIVCTFGTFLFWFFDCNIKRHPKLELGILPISPTLGGG